MPRLSVVIPAYNNADYIAQTVNSVLAQDYSDFELIIADHSSTDETMAILETYAADPRVTLLSTPAGGGAPRNWTRVTDAATGELLKLVCGDDLLYPGALSAQVAAFDEVDDVVMVASRRDIVDASGRPFIEARGLTGLRGTMDGASAVRASIRAGTNLFGEPACVMVRRDVLMAAGGWDGRFPYLIDQASYSAVLLRGRFTALPQPAAAFRVNDGQWSVTLSRSQATQAREFHASVRAAHPTVVSSGDVRLGNARASINALLRRLVYVVFGRRLRAPARGER